MTRQEFIDTITDFYELRDFAHENELYEQVDDLLTDDEIDEEVSYGLADLARSESWRCVRDILSDVPTNTGWFVRIGYLQYEDADNDTFEDLKQEILEAADEKDVWDEEEDEEPDGVCDPDSIVLALFGAKAS